CEMSRVLRFHAGLRIAHRCSAKAFGKASAERPAAIGTRSAYAFALRGIDDRYAFARRSTWQEISGIRKRLGKMRGRDSPRDATGIASSPIFSIPRFPQSFKTV